MRATDRLLPSASGSLPWTAAAASVASSTEGTVVVDWVPVVGCAVLLPASAEAALLLGAGSDGELVPLPLVPPPDGG
jgi:hypothetical protein